MHFKIIQLTIFFNYLQIKKNRKWLKKIRCKLKNIALNW